MTCCWKHLLPFQQSGQAHPSFPTLFSMRGCKPVTRLSSQDWESLEEGFKPQNSCSWSQSPHCPARRLQHQSKKVSSKKRLFLVKYCGWVYCPWRRGEKNWRNQEPVLWWLQNWTVISVWTCGNTFRRAVPRLNASHAVFSTTLHLLESKIRAAQACSLFLVPVPPIKESSFKRWRLLLAFVRHLKTLKMVTWYWAGAVLLKCCCWKQCYANINILLARPTWYLYVALCRVNICTELRCLSSVLGCLLLTYPPFPLWWRLWTEGLTWKPSSFSTL